MSTEIQIPQWLKKLFALFTANYNALWADRLADPEIAQAMVYMWVEALKGYQNDLIFKAGMEIIKNSKHPPSISEFLETVNTLSRNHRMDNTAQKLLSEDYKPSPPSPLLAEYMAKNPPMADDEFKYIFDNYRGEERGKRMIALIKQKLRGKVIRSHCG